MIKSQNLLVFFQSPDLLYYVRVKFVYPSFTALLVNSVGKALSNLLPITLSKNLDSRFERLVLLLGPRCVGLARVFELEIALVALNHRLDEKLTDSGPLLAIKSDAFEQLLILFLRPLDLSLLVVLLLYKALHWQY